MAFFDATLFTVVPRLYRALDAALDPPTGSRDRVPPRTAGRTGTRPPRVGPFLRLGQLDRRGPRRQPGRDRGDHRADAADPGRPRPARLRGGRDAADADDRGRDHERPGGAAARLAPGPRRRGPARDRPAAPAPLPRRAVPPAVRVHRRAAAPDAGRPGRRGGAADRAVRRRRRARRGARRDLRTRSSPTGSTASPGARSPSCAGSSGRSGSTSPRSRSASTRRSTRLRSRRSEPAPPGTTEVAAGRDPRRGPRHVPGDRRGPGAVRGRRLPSLRRQLHGVGHRTSPTSSSWRGTPWRAPTTPPPVLDVVPLFESSERARGGRARSSARCSTIRPTEPASRRAAIARR